MIKDQTRKKIDKAIKSIWLTDICREYGQWWFRVEPDIQCSLYHHLRERLNPLLAENNLYIYSEFYVPEKGQKIDLAIFEMDMSRGTTIRDCCTDTAAIIELKYGGGNEWITSDFPKMRGYMDIFGKSCQYYFGVIDLRELASLNWLDGRNRWAKDCFTELNAGYLGGEMYFGVHSYNGMNPTFENRHVRCRFITE